MEVPTRRQVAGALLMGLGPPLFVLVNLRFPGLRVEWAWGNVLLFLAAMTAPFVVLFRSTKWPAGVRRGIAITVVAPAALLALVSSGCGVFEVFFNGPEPTCEALATYHYAGTDAVVSWCCEGGAIGHCSIDADQVWHVLPGLRLQWKLDAVLGGNEAKDVGLSGHVLEFTVLKLDGEHETVRTALKRWVWL